MAWLTDTILRLAGPLVLVVTFALPALEASTLLGIVVPGELALLLGGAPVATGGLRQNGGASADRPRQLACSSATAAVMWERWVSAWG